MKQESSYFPVFIDLSDKKIVVVGGGTIACRRIKTLLPFVECLIVAAPVILPELQELALSKRICWVQERYRREQILDADLVLACTDDEQINDEIYSVCRCLGIMVNVCSDRRKCDFYFPGIVKKEDVVVGITANGKDHKRAKEVREKIEDLLEEEQKKWK